MSQLHDEFRGHWARAARERTRRVALTLAALAAAGIAGQAGSQVSPNGPEFQVNTYTLSGQDMPKAATDAQGRFVVVWTSFGSSGTDTSWASVQGQRYDANGRPLGGEFQVNTYTTYNQWEPAVAADAQGNFVVVWDSLGSSGTDQDGYSLQAQRFASNGAPLGSQFQVNTYSTGDQAAGAVAADAQGRFVVVWISYGSSGTDTSGASIQARRYDANGTPLGGQFQVNTYTSNHQWRPSVSSDSQGNFVVVWNSQGSPGTDISLWSVQARRYAANGSPLGDQFQVNTYTTDDQWLAAVAADAQGNFVVAWDSYGSNGSDTDSWSIQARRYDVTGTPLGVEFQVNAYTTNGQHSPVAAADAQGNFVVAWQSYGSSGTDLDWSIQAQRFGADGTPSGGQFQVNTYTTDQQSSPCVAADGSGNFLVAWESFGSAGTDTESLSVLGQRYDALFRDGFESGGTSRWSVALP